MRTHGIDGECISCHQPPAQRCEHCKAVRLAPGNSWEYHPGPVALGEVPATCSLCAEQRRAEAERAYWSALREAERRKRRGFGPAPEGTDSFEGFRG